MKWLDYRIQDLRLRQALPWLRPGTRLVDIGCADGVLRHRVPGLAGYVGVDPDAPVITDETQVEFLRSSFPAPSLRERPAETFDAITALAVLEHVPAEEQLDFARECARLLAPEGVLVLTVPARVVDHILSALEFIRLIDGMKKEEHYGFDPLETPNLFRGLGLELVVHRRFECGLNHLFVFRKARSPRDSTGKADEA